MKVTPYLKFSLRFRSNMVHTILIFSSNWNNDVNTRVSYLNSNNVTSNSNQNIGTQLSLGRAMARGLVVKQLLNLANKTKRQNTIISENSVSNHSWVKALFFTLVTGEA